MDTLNNSPLFNAGGLATVFSYFGINLTNFMKLTDINLLVIISIGVLSALFTAMKMYHQWLITKRLKKQIKEELRIELEEARKNKELQLPNNED